MVPFCSVAAARGIDHSDYFSSFYLFAKLWEQFRFGFQPQGVPWTSQVNAERSLATRSRLPRDAQRSQRPLFTGRETFPKAPRTGQNLPTLSEWSEEQPGCAEIPFPTAPAAPTDRTTDPEPAGH